MLNLGEPTGPKQNWCFNTIPCSKTFFVIFKQTQNMEPIENSDSLWKTSIFGHSRPLSLQLGSLTGPEEKIEVLIPFPYVT